jgi:hypothetical protein
MRLRAPVPDDVRAVLAVHGDERQLLHGLVLTDRDLVLLVRDHPHVRLEDRGEHVAQRDHLLVDELQVIVDVAEELRQLVTDLDVRAALERLERGQQGVDGAVEVRRLAAQQVDPLVGAAAPLNTVSSTSSTSSSRPSMAGA